MKPVNLFAFIFILLSFGSCGFFKDYSKDNRWSYFEEWDNNTDSRVDKEEFVKGCLRDGFVDKSNASTEADALFTKADENQDGFLTGLEFYRWKVRM